MSKNRVLFFFVIGDGDGHRPASGNGKVGHGEEHSPPRHVFGSGEQEQREDEVEGGGIVAGSPAGHAHQAEEMFEGVHEDWGWFYS